MAKKANNKKKAVIKHLKGDIKTFKKESDEDRELIKDLKEKNAIKGNKKRKN